MYCTTGTRYLQKLYSTENKVLSRVVVLQYRAGNGLLLQWGCTVKLYICFKVGTVESFRLTEFSYSFPLFALITGAEPGYELS